MPTYYFDTMSAELENDVEARDQAIALLPDMARDELPDGDRHEFLARVRNERGETVYEARLHLDGRWWPRPP